MRVLLDAHMLGHRETGNESYVRELLWAFAEAGKRNVTAMLSAESSTDEPPLPAAIGLRRFASPSNVWRLAVGLRQACREHAATILHVSYNGPVSVAAPLVVSVHDVSFRRHPEFFSPRLRLQFATVQRYSLWRADAVITTSEWSRQDLLTFYPFLRDRVFVTPLAASPRYRRYGEPEVAAFLQRCGIDRPYILYVGLLEPRKNIHRLLSAYAVLAEHCADPPVLVLAGKSARCDRDTARDLAAMEQRGFVRVLGYIPLEELPLLYNGAMLFVFPSFYEGFGLPVVEAMACGTPVVASNRTAIPELAGNAALLVDPGNVAELAVAMERLVASAALRRELGHAGLERAAGFSWRRTAELTWQAYEETVNRWNHPAQSKRFRWQ
ncbi:MAG: glycosyltransferase family 4 protein [Candidatus Schekmanbacteria bacterium]|nr:glycosyltransferase family 4 protein [Candidatus Schekmanbacteria bacterium]